MTPTIRATLKATPTPISLLLLASAIVSTIGACQPGDQPGPEYMPDMARGPAYKAFAPNAATRSGITLQRPVAGTIARGYQPFHYGKGDPEAIRAGIELTNPYHATSDVVAKGKALFQIYCQVCHGAAGKGDGPISTKIPPPPSYKSDRIMAYPPGRFFHVITMGANKMPSYAVQLAPHERWQIITYIQSELQGVQEAEPGSLPPAAVPTTGPAVNPALGMSTSMTPGTTSGSGGGK